MITESCNISASDPSASCMCWTEDANLWFPKSAWLPTMFADVPPPYLVNLRAKVCRDDSRKMHVAVADNSIALDFPLLVNDPTDPEKTLFVQRGFCYRCGRFEWTRTLTKQPTTPVTWIKCTKRNKRNK